MRKFIRRHGGWVVAAVVLVIAFRDWSILLFLAFVWGSVQAGVWLRNRNRIKEENNAK